MRTIEFTGQRVFTAPQEAWALEWTGSNLTAISRLLGRLNQGAVNQFRKHRSAHPPGTMVVVIDGQYLTLTKAAYQTLFKQR